MIMCLDFFDGYVPITTIYLDTVTGCKSLRYGCAKREIQISNYCKIVSNES